MNQPIDIKNITFRRYYFHNWSRDLTEGYLNSERLLSMVHILIILSQLGMKKCPQSWKFSIFFVTFSKEKSIHIPFGGGFLLHYGVPGYFMGHW